MDRTTGGDLFEVRDSIEKPTQRAARTPEQREQLISGVLGSGWRDGYRDCRGGFWLVTSSKPQPAVVSTASPAPGRRCAKRLPREKR